MATGCSDTDFDTYGVRWTCVYLAFKRLVLRVYSKSVCTLLKVVEVENEHRVLADSVPWSIADTVLTAGLRNILPITTAKVPIVKFEHRQSGLEGDISLYNTLVSHAAPTHHHLDCECRLGLCWCFVWCVIAGSAQHQDVGHIRSSGSPSAVSGIHNEGVCKGTSHFVAFTWVCTQRCLTRVYWMDGWMDESESESHYWPNVQCT